jgi:uncharacterized membrane protein
MRTARINRKAAAIVTGYAAFVIAINIFLSEYGYTPLVFYSSLFWIVLPLLIYSVIRNRIVRRKEN